MLEAKRVHGATLSDVLLTLVGGAAGNAPMDATTTGTGELIDHALDKHVTLGLGQRDLSQGVEGLENKIPTTENLALLVWERLATALAQRVELERVRVYESPDLYVDYDGGE